MGIGVAESRGIKRGVVVNLEAAVESIKRAIDESTRTVVSRDGWKLCLRDKDLNELYHLNVDPLETHNLYADREYASVISRYTDEIHRWQESTNDKLRL